MNYLNTNNHILDIFGHGKLEITKKKWSSVFVQELKMHNHFWLCRGLYKWLAVNLSGLSAYRYALN